MAASLFSGYYFLFSAVRSHLHAYQIIYLNLGNSFMNQHIISFTASEASCGINVTK